MSPRGSAAHLRGRAERGADQAVATGQRRLFRRVPGGCFHRPRASISTRPGGLFPRSGGIKKLLTPDGRNLIFPGKFAVPSSNGPRSISGSSSAVEHHLAKVRVAGSSPVSRPRTWRHSQVAKARDCKSSIAGSNPAAALFSSKYPTLPTLKTVYHRRHPHRKRPVSRPSFHVHSGSPSARGERRRLAGHSSLQRPMLRSTLTIDQSIKTI